MEKEKIDLDLPVDAYDAEGNRKESESVSEEISPEVSQTEEKKEVVDKSEEEEQRVPYSRFNKVREQKEQAEREADEARSILRQIQSERSQPVYRESSPSSYEEDIKKSIIELFGNTPDAHRIADIQIKAQRVAEERAERRALEAVERQRTGEAMALSQNERVIESRVENFTDRLGRDLTEQEQNSLLEIVDEYTPVGPDGKYAGEILSFDKAWEVYSLRQGNKTQATKRSRNAATVASSSRSSGEPTGEVSEKDKNWNPMNWKSLYDRIR